MFEPTVVISVHVLLLGDLSILKPVSLFELSVHDTFICVVETADAAGFVGGFGIVTGGACVVAFTDDVYAELPAPLYDLIL